MRDRRRRSEGEKSRRRKGISYLVYIMLDDKVGTLEVGKAADLLVVNGDPLSDISVLQDQSRLLLIMKEGYAYVDRMAD